MFFPSLDLAIENSALPSTGHSLQITADKGLISVQLNSFLLGVLATPNHLLSGTDGTWINSTSVLKREGVLDTLIQRGIERINRQPLLSIFYGATHAN